MKQRLGIASALLKDPDVLILDEPTIGLDPKGMAGMRTFIRELGSGRRTVLLSSHLMSEVEHVCDRVGVINRGVLVKEGTVDELRGRRSLIVRATPVEQASRVLEGLPEASGIRVHDDVFTVTADPASTATINRTLVEAGVAVSELRSERASLEEVFLGLTKDDEEGSR
jgi:ABC-2 type transport system ATP-binding protein